VEVRLAEPGDLAGVRAIAGHYGNLEAWPSRPDYLDHELERGALWVALDARSVAGFAAVLVDGGVAHLADAFVRPDALGGGIGRALLDAAFPPDVTRVTFASGDPRALPLYVRAGMQPLAPLLYLEGELPGTPAGAPVPPAELVERDAAASGRARPAALEFLTRAGAHGRRAGEHAYAVVRPAGPLSEVGPAAGGATELPALLAGLGPLRLALPGPHPALRPLLDAGLRIAEQDTFMASRPGVLDLERYVPHADLG
jgi:GNAT superfamily N-acetyltransferase